MDLAKGDDASALASLAIILRSSRQYRVLRSRADILFRRESFEDAIPAYDVTLVANPMDTEAVYRRGLCNERLDDQVQALHDYEGCVQISEGKHLEALRHLARLQFKTGQHQKSVYTSTTWLKQQPPDIVDAFLLRGRAFKQLRDDRHALRDFSQVIHLDPNNAEAFYQRGCLLRAAYPTQALQDLSVSIMLRSLYPAALVQRGLIYMRQKVQNNWAKHL